MNRRQCLQLGSLLAAPLTLAEQSKPRMSSADAPELIVVNANVLTVDAARPRAEAFAVRDGRFLAIGSMTEIRALARGDAKIIDAAQMTVVPGFIDAHCHPGGLLDFYDVNMDLRTIAEIQAALRERAAQTPPGFWVEGYKFDDGKLKDARPLSRQDLDSAVPDHPVCVIHRGGHTAYYNSRAFELAGITRESADPPHGRFIRDGSGDLQGQVTEGARAVFDTVGLREQFTPEQQRQRSVKAIAAASRMLTRAGLTSVHDAGADEDKIRTYQDARASGDLLHRAYIFPIGFTANCAYQKLRDAGIYTGLGDERVRIGAAKFMADGSASERTMRMSTPYVGRPGDYGTLTLDQKQIHEAVEDAHRHGWQVATHANGDVAIDLVLNAYERVLRLWPLPSRRHRIEHCSLVNPDLIRRIKATGSVLTPFWTYVYYNDEKWAAYGEEKMASMFAHRSMLEAGIPVAAGSDYPAGPCEPMLALQSLVTRKGWTGKVWGANQKITIEQALRVGTINGAYASNEEQVKGSISVGKYADFVILEKDPRAVDPDTLKDIRIVRTVVGGQTVHELT